MTIDPADPAALTAPVEELVAVTEEGSIRLGEGVLRLAGEVDAHLCERWRGTGADLVDVEVVDAREVTFLGSPGLALLAQVVRARGSGLPLWTTQRAVLRVLRMTGMDQLFDVRDGA